MVLFLIHPQQQRNLQEKNSINISFHSLTMDIPKEDHTRPFTKRVVVDCCQLAILSPYPSRSQKLIHLLYTHLIGDPPPFFYYCASTSSSSTSFVLFYTPTTTRGQCSSFYYRWRCDKRHFRSFSPTTPTSSTTTLDLWPTSVSSDNSRYYSVGGHSVSVTFTSILTRFETGPNKVSQSPVANSYNIGYFEFDN